MHFRGPLKTKAKWIFIQTNVKTLCSDLMLKARISQSHPVQPVLQHGQPELGCVQLSWEHLHHWRLHRLWATKCLTTLTARMSFSIRLFQKKTCKSRSEIKLLVKIVKLLKYYKIHVSDWVIKSHWGRQRVFPRDVRPTNVTKDIILILSLWPDRVSLKQLLKTCGWCCDTRCILSKIVSYVCCTDVQGYFTTLERSWCRCLLLLNLPKKNPTLGMLFGNRLNFNTGEIVWAHSKTIPAW